MASVLSKYVVLLEAQTAKYQRELEGAQKKLARFERQNTKSLDLIKKGFAAFGIGLGLREIAQFAKSTADAAIQMQRFERTLKVATGSSEAAHLEMDFVRKVADDLGLSLESTALQYSKLAAAARGSALQGQDTRDIFVAVSEASRVMGLSAEQTEGALRSIEQMMSKGTVQAEELRGQLSERLPGAFQTAAKAMGVTTSELNDMLKKGEVLAEDLLPAMAVELHKTFGPGVAEAANDAQAAFTRLNTAIFELKVAIAESGLLEYMAKAAEFATNAANSFRRFVDPGLQDQIRATVDEIRELESLKGFAGGVAPNIDKEIAELKTKLDGFYAQLKEQSVVVPLTVDIQPIDIESALESAKELRTDNIKLFTGGDQRVKKEFDDLWQSFVEGYATAEQSIAAEMEKFDTVAHMFPPEEQERIRDAIRKPLTEGLEEINLNSIRAMKRVADEIETVNESARELGLTFTSAFEDAVVEGKKLSDIFKGILQDLTRMLIRKTLTEPLTGFFSGLFEGKASGGPVGAGTPYVVGEEGPEIFVPRASGNIIPNGVGGAAITQHFHVQAGLPPQWQAQLATVTQIAASAAHQSVQKEFGGRR